MGSSETNNTEKITLNILNTIFGIWTLFVIYTSIFTVYDMIVKEVSFTIAIFNVLDLWFLFMKYLGILFGILFVGFIPIFIYALISNNFRKVLNGFGIDINWIRKKEN